MRDFDMIGCVVGGRDNLSDETLTDVLAHLNSTVLINTTGPVSLLIDGYDDDPRELWEIPEVVAYMRRVYLGLEIGVISRLDEMSRIICAVCCGVLRPVGKDPVTGNTSFEVI